MAQNRRTPDDNDHQHVEVYRYGRMTLTIRRDNGRLVAEWSKNGV